MPRPGYANAGAGEAACPVGRNRFCKMAEGAAP